MEKLLILFFILLSVIPFFFLNKWLQKLVMPRRSPGRLMLYFLVVLELIFLYTWLLILLLANLFPLPKG